MQYFKPEGAQFVGDCMPFFHNGVFRLFYLLDEGHHSALGGLGGHQWAQASSPDLIHWHHHPLAIPITEEREGSICTGSVLFHAGTYYGFYATRMRDRTQHLSLATSQDGVHFEKQAPNPFASPPPGYSLYHYRDPVAFWDERTGLFHLLVTAWLEHHAVADRGGCLAHLVSADLRRWESREPFIVPGLPGAPECPDYFRWNGWYYLIFSNGGIARYRMSRQPLGPWTRPPVDTLDGPAARVMKTAAFTGDRRLGVAWIGTRQGDKDDGLFEFGGSAVFREILQHPDGTLGTAFPPELVPPAVGDLRPGVSIQAVTSGATVGPGGVRLAARPGLAVAVAAGVPAEARLSARVMPGPDAAGFGFHLRATDHFDSGCDLGFHPYDRTARLGDQWLGTVEGLDRPFAVEIVLKDDLVDVCIDGRRTIIDRCPEQRGDRLLLYAQDGDAGIELTGLSRLR